MFAKTIVLSDAFLDMPLGARCLYMTMGMIADDDGFVNAPKSIMRQSGASEDDLKVLIAKKFVIPFESGVIVIKHWRINNYLQRDRIQPTKYQEELGELQVEKNGAYTKITQDVYIDNVYTEENSIEEYSIDKNKERVKGKSTAFTPPSLDDVTQYCHERNNKVDPQRFIDFYESKGWMIGKNKMKDWRAAVRTWEKRDETPKKKEKDYTQRDYKEIDFKELEKRKLGIGGT